MSSTNKTTNYELSQFIGTDKPAWLADYNSDMSKIDAQMKDNADGVTVADGKADSNATAIGTLANLTTTAKTDLVSAVNEVDSNADTAQNTANTANNTASSAYTIASGLATSLNLSVRNDLTATASRGSIISNSMKIARAEDGSVCKIYGQIDINNLAVVDNNVTITLSGTGLTPSSQFSINPIGLRVYIRTNNTSDTQTCNGTFNTDGTISITFPTSTDCSLQRIILMPTITFVEDFGD